MGKMIGEPAWLHDLYLNTPSAREGAKSILRAYVLLFNRRGHLLNLDTEKVRREITYGLKRGYIEIPLVECALCRTGAFLGDWIRSADYSPDAIGAILADNKAKVHPLLYRFLLPCDECLRIAGTEIPDSTRGAGR